MQWYAAGFTFCSHFHKLLLPSRIDLVFTVNFFFFKQLY